ncbi:hypothetical protein TH53_17480 [Pedobacter lusitanus]|uniref:Immunity protein 63 domain-containing protein n=1 Tax=Pedobacter lusitanus TaxID=1503925 RepID=A0A0D0GNF2_9SPHI|nr:hypothetical protein TH53_17480 [Pedobacter lusitanus]
MNREELKQKLEELNVYPGFYSLNGELLPDRIVLNHNYDKWEVFYFDERGNRDSEKTFSSENDACNYIYRYFIRQKGI